ncbi:hypothetical protein C8A05DRAFT_20139 [Staphylotrichum tortipilum]|uniref:CCHC-type domain-containing protein n=1 Tax=Staphylotrichum tortipilum TaxID=2831512 RepID=A0AAN6MBE6_9PEZI|nr:hypothetical protein C8A05DRAFT_20139 [Staphylotrichum longicolle]
MDVDANQKDSRPWKDKSSITCYGCGKQGHFKRDCRDRKKDGWKAVPGKETATIEKGIPLIEVSAHDVYAQDDFDVTPTDWEQQDAQEQLDNAISQALDEVAQNTDQADVEVKEAQRLNTNPGNNVFQPNDAPRRIDIRWEGPLDDRPQEDLRGNEVCHPENKYRREQEKRQLQGKKSQERDDYWNGRPYFSTGRSNDDVDWSQAQTFQIVEGECRRLHPGRADHIQAPWFQCVTDVCGYHYKEKLSNDHWPVRTTNDDGLPKPLIWTFDHGSAPESFLWTYRTVDGGRLRVVPRRAWPEECHIHWTPDQCPSKDCVFHLWDKAYREHDRRQARRARQQQHRAREAAVRARKAQKTTLAADVSNMDQPDDIAEGDASQSQHDLGNDSGAFPGPSKH